MSKQDVGEFEKFAPHYFEYVNDCLQKNFPTLLAKIFGIYKVVIKKKDTVLLERPVLVIENLFCDRKIVNKYDLKGSERNRLVDTTAGQTGETVLLDENLIKGEDFFQNVQLITCISQLLGRNLFTFKHIHKQCCVKPSAVTLRSWRKIT